MARTAKGNRELGAPDLTDAIWLNGSGEAAIAAQVRAPKHGVMPAWAARLGDTTVKELAVYVHSLGGGRVGPSRRIGAAPARRPSVECRAF